jgi:Conserved protein/domain typically associated with flavoprotein oxygenases, DIM6/NTAB family
MSAKFKEISPLKINENSIKMIGSDWMLITAGDKSRFNTMTASWGFMGEIWGEHAIIAMIRPQRYTFEFIEKSNVFTLSFLEDGNKDTLNLCGTRSGRDIDKISATGLIPVFKDDIIFFEQAKLVLVCEKMYASDFDPEKFTDKSLPQRIYSADDYHRVYIAKILKVYKKEI